MKAIQVILITIHANAKKDMASKIVQKLLIVEEVLILDTHIAKKIKTLLQLTVGVIRNH